MTRYLVAIATLAAGLALTGCDGGSKNTDPKPAVGTTADPRLKPAARGDAGGGHATRKAPTPAPLNPKN